MFFAGVLCSSFRCSFSILDFNISIGEHHLSCNGCIARHVFPLFHTSATLWVSISKRTCSKKLERFTKQEGCKEAFTSHQPKTRTATHLIESNFTISLTNIFGYDTGACYVVLENVPPKIMVNHLASKL